MSTFAVSLKTRPQNRLDMGQHRRSVFQAGIRNEIGRSLKGGGRLFSLGEIDKRVSVSAGLDGIDTVQYGKIQGFCQRPTYYSKRMREIS